MRGLSPPLRVEAFAGGGEHQPRHGLDGRRRECRGRLWRLEMGHAPAQAIPCRQGSTGPNKERETRIEFLVSTSVTTLGLPFNDLKVQQFPYQVCSEREIAVRIGQSDCLGIERKPVSALRHSSPHRALSNNY